VLFGHSTGGQVALRAAELVSDQVTRLVLAGPTVPPELRRLPALTLATVRDLWREPPGLVPATFPYYLRAGPGPLLRYVRSARRDEPERVVPRLTCPIQILRGQDDRFCPEDWADRLAASARNGKVVTLPGAHGFPYRHGRLTASYLTSPASPDVAGAS
jgi:pimeloyl-ACP methyl ester carboxylesterase